MPRLPRPDRRTLQAAAVCALAAVLALAAPLAMFALGDAARFGRPAAAQTPYQSRQVQGDDLYLVRMLREREQAELELYQARATGSSAADSGFYLPAQTDLQYSELLAPRTARMLQEMQDAGVLPIDWLYPLIQRAESDPAHFVGSTDTLGFLTVANDNAPADPGEFASGWETDVPSGTAALELPFVNLVAESRTGKVVSLQGVLPGIGLPAPDPRQALRAWVSLNDLDLLGDWEVPEGTCWEDNGLYSRSGELLATLIFAQDEDAGVSLFSLDLAPCPPSRLQAARNALPGQESGISDSQITSGALQPVRPWYNTGDAYYFYEPVSSRLESPMRLLQVDFSNGSYTCPCTLPGCAHDTLDCPACFGDQYATNTGLYVENGAIYLFLPRRFDPYTGGERAAEIQVVSAGGTRRDTVASLPDDMQYLAAGGGTVYGLLRTDSYDYGTRPASLAAVSLTDGTRTVTDALLAPGEQVLGCQGGLLVTARQNDRRAGAAGGSDFVGAWLRAGGTSELCLLDPVTGSRRQAATLEGKVTQAGHIGGTVWGVALSPGRPNGGVLLQRVDLLTGEAEDVMSAPGGLIQAIAVADRAAPGSGRWDGWVYVAFRDNDCLYGPNGEFYALPPLSAQGWQLRAAAGSGIFLYAGEGDSQPLCLAWPEDLAAHGEDAIMSPVH